MSLLFELVKSHLDTRRHLPCPPSGSSKPGPRGGAAFWGGAGRLYGRGQRRAIFFFPSPTIFFLSHHRLKKRLNFSHVVLFFSSDPFEQQHERRPAVSHLPRIPWRRLMLSLAPRLRHSGLPPCLMLLSFFFVSTNPACQQPLSRTTSPLASLLVVVLKV